MPEEEARTPRGRAARIPGDLLGVIENATGSTDRGVSNATLETTRYGKHRIVVGEEDGEQIPLHLPPPAPASTPPWPARRCASLDLPGPNAGNQIIELVNTSGSPFRAPTNWRFCIRPSYIRVPSVQIPAGGIVQLHIGASGVNTATDWYLPTVAQLPLSGEMAIYATNFFFDTPDFMRAFVSWAGWRARGGGGPP